ncbi:MAG: hypothetical protein HOW97_42190, partial [Catenulispora sp.]|nr:hypothetical protein [Catenulispora sp.]
MSVEARGCVAAGSRACGPGFAYARGPGSRRIGPPGPPGQPQRCPPFCERLAVVGVGAALCEADELAVVDGLAGGELLAVVEGAELDVGGAALELDALVLGADVETLWVDAAVVGAAVLLVEVGEGAGLLVPLVGVGLWAERGSGLGLVVAAPVTEAAGGVPGWSLPLRSTSTSAVDRAAMTATARIPTTQPAPPPRPSGGGSPMATRSGARPRGCSGGITRVSG